MTAMLAILGGVLAAVVVEFVRRAVGRARRHRSDGDAAFWRGESDRLRAESWLARNEAYRWKRRALRLGWRRDATRWDR